ncbi:MAG: hypothetical protein AB7F91_12675 [Parvularculaceae bacterium]
MARRLKNGAVRGPVDEPFLMIDHTLSAGCTTSANGAAACERWAHQNRLGSVVAVTSSTGAVVERHTYGPYGEVGGSPSGFPFCFIGQKIDAETGLYYYKARFNDPETGAQLGLLGSSGNSTEPHLHSQVCDAPDPLMCAGIPVQWADVEVLVPELQRASQSGDLVRKKPAQ